MEILGIGPMELILILIIATVVFGPDKLPEIGAKLGQGLKSLRGITREFTRETKELREAVTAPVREIEQPIKELVAPVREDLAGLAPMAQAVTNPQEALRQAVAREMTAATAPAVAAVEAAASAASFAPVPAGSRGDGRSPAGGSPAATQEAAGETITRELVDDVLPAAAPQAVLPAATTPQEALRRAVVRELGLDKKLPAPEASDTPTVTAEVGSEQAGTTEVVTTPGAEQAGTREVVTTPAAEQPTQPVPFFGYPRPGAGVGQTAAGPVSGMSEPAGTVMPPAAGATADELPPQRIVRLKPRRLNRPYFGRNTEPSHSPPVSEE